MLVQNLRSYNLLNAFGFPDFSSISNLLENDVK